MQQHRQIEAILQNLGSVVVAYSGGVDSTLMAKLAHDVLGAKAIAVTAKSPSLFPADLAAACAQAQAIGIAHHVVETAELNNPDYAQNPPNRCYFCKSELHDTLRPLAQGWGMAAVVDGLNADDVGDYRPGIAAAKERGVRSPLAEVGMTKLAVRQLARELGLANWNRPASPCLSSRFPYGEAITLEKLERVGAAEFYLKERLGLDWELRVRSRQDVATIEIPPQRFGEFWQQIQIADLIARFRALGFAGVVLDLEGFRSGKLNDALAARTY
ncbi:MAG: ATP-dependent sacrificial sulfur transferase LarE [Oscillatoriales cyanobacterium SM2_1_8]|nr:ATP-dependent sacrificial sulfur transferase LarE [Oscillatoriales cyanobacterium SM2_1_8]